MHFDIKSVINLKDPKDLAGYILGCISALFYVASRVPQIVKNVRECLIVKCVSNLVCGCDTHPPTPTHTHTHTHTHTV